MTNATIAPVDAGCVIHPALRLAERVLHECSTAMRMTADGLWRINPTSAHGAANLSGPPRLHLILDCHDGLELDRFRAAEVLPPTSLRLLPLATPEELDQAARETAALARLGWVEEAERALLGLYFRRALPADGYAYDMITSMHVAAGEHEAAGIWQDRKHLTLGGVQ